jgi:hypothetical protein
MCQLIAPALLTCAAICGLLVWVEAESERWLWVGLAVSTILVAGAVVASLSAPASTTVGRSCLAVAVLVSAALGGGLLARAGLQWAGMSKIAGTLPASAWIGVVERLTLTLALLLSLPEIAALVIAVKALGQYAETSGSATPENHAAAARILGTLLSLAWALGCYASWRVALAR